VKRASLVKIIALLAVVSIWFIVSYTRIVQLLGAKDKKETSGLEGLFEIEGSFADKHLHKEAVGPEQGEISQIIAEFEKAIRKDSKHPELYYELGKIYSQEGEFFDAEKAIHYFQECLKLASDEVLIEKARRKISELENERHN